MASVKDLRDQIRSLKNTQQITKAMKQVAAAKIRRAETAQKQARPYAETLGEMLRELVGAVSRIDHPFMNPGNASAPSGMILMTADKGLCGAFNANVIRQGESFLREHPGAVMYSVGVKARQAVRRLGGGERPTWPLNAASKLDVAREVAKAASEAFVAGEISEVVLVSSKMLSMLVQRPQTLRLVPVAREGIAGDAEASGPKAMVEFAPSPEAVLSQLLPKYLEFTIFSAMLETDAAFFAAQLVAMNNATDNAGKLIDEYTIQMNNARQAAITKELLEIVGGAEALNG